MTVKHVGVPNTPRVRINRGDRKPPYLSDIVTGTQEQLTPNGCAYNGPWPEQDLATANLIGAENAITPPATSWPKGNRSGE